MRAFDEHLASLDRTWVQRVLRKFAEDHPSHVHIESTNTESSSNDPMDGVEVAHDEKVSIPPRPLLSAASVTHLSEFLLPSITHRAIYRSWHPSSPPLNTTSSSSTAMARTSLAPCFTFGSTHELLLDEDLLLHSHSTLIYCEPSR